eukprot:CAMPEP_0115768026 /NCGR_PEP_ID=MMETSP0272-20121206/103974_1 /TAXON_ID=71861 /ORGANISM="Scrippsiella trochoidea, Strain CCMP3099" /LENGTH=103 /DNA_ID=CAMNT_0003214053 /DNA_START=44 /DNA_END=356 /DNA_ORIENTATION=+
MKTGSCEACGVVRPRAQDVVPAAATGHATLREAAFPGGRGDVGNPAAVRREGASTLQRRIFLDIDPLLAIGFSSMLHIGHALQRFTRGRRPQHYAAPRLQEAT